MQYWINQDGVQSGPVDYEGLKEMALTPRAFIWHEGLPNWVSITQLPELKGLYNEEAQIAADAPVHPQTAEASVADGGQDAAARSETAIVGQPYEAEQPVRPQGNWANQTANTSWQAQGEVQQPDAPGPCPPTNLVWAIISTICCCLPAGIVAIIYSVKVTNKYNMGDFKGAERASETSAWWCIAAIVLGIISAPLVYLLPMLGQ